MAFVSNEMVIAHLKGVDEAEGFDIDAKVRVAQALVLKHIDRESYTGWSDDTDPDADTEFAIVQAAILKVLMNLYRFRGDDEELYDPLDGVKSMLQAVGLRDPSLA